MIRVLVRTFRVRKKWGSLPKRLVIKPFYRSIYRFSSSNLNNNELLSLAKGVISGKRRDLSRAITIVESTNAEHSKQAQTLLNYIYSQKSDENKNQNQNNNKKNKPFRIGITGPPGAGKSTFVNALGCVLCSEPYNFKVAVLPIDPSSFLSGGSILGDQTRMIDLFRNKNSFVRPSPNRLSLGGITDTTYEVCSLCELAGYDIVFVETVGVGQSEIEVANCVDLFVLVMTPTSGDDLQGLKRGIMEMSDIIIINKAEDDMLSHARHIKADFKRALQLIHKRREYWNPKILLCSCMDPINTDKNVKNIWNEIEEFQDILYKDNHYENVRKEQSKYATWKHVWRNIRSNINLLKPKLINIEENVMNNKISPREGCQLILSEIYNNSSK